MWTPENGGLWRAWKLCCSVVISSLIILFTWRFFAQSSDLEQYLAAFRTEGKIWDLLKRALYSVEPIWIFLNYEESIEIFLLPLLEGKNMYTFETIPVKQESWIEAFSDLTIYLQKHLTCKNRLILFFSTPKHTASTS